MTAAIETRGLVKTYGEKRALDGLDLDVPEGSVFGFLGPNGAGKTTTLRILSGLSHPASGEARIYGRDVVSATNETRADIGYLPDVPGFYDWMTAEEFMHFTGSLFGIDRRTLVARTESLLGFAGLGEVHARIGGYSRGMKQRLGVAQALVSAPKLLMLDEPTSALDPIGRKQLLEMIASLRGRTTVFFSTHVLSDIERVCDRVAILDAGRVVRSGPIEELRARHGATRLVVEVEGPAAALAERVGREPWATDVVSAEDGALSIATSDIAHARQVLPVLIAELGLGLVRFETAEVSLEDVFVDLVGGEGL